MILGERVRLRHTEREDLTFFVEWLNDPDVRRGLMLHLPLSIAEEEQWFENMLTSPQDERPLVIEAKTEDDWTMIGNSSFHNLDWRNRNAELGIFIGEKSYWDRGYGTEVMRLLLKHGFNTLNLHMIYLRVYEDNLRAIRAYEKSGFVEDGRLRQMIFKDGEFLDVIFMSVLRAEWRENDQ
jgi:RimJ/RimL family protein N-acetyltransferase